MDYKVWYGAAAIVLKEDYVLMVRAKDGNSWSFPSGGVEDGETAQQACVREIAEETGYEAKIVKALHTKKAIIKNYAVTTDYFLCEITGGAIEYLDPDEEIAEIAWKHRDELATLVHTYPEDLALIAPLFCHNSK